MEENFVGYLLDALDSDTRSDVEKYLDTEPGARQRLEAIRRALTPLESDKDSIDPPAGLVVRTLGRLAEYRCRPLPQAPPPPPRMTPVGRSWWRRADALVAACLLLGIGGLSTTWIASQRAEARKVECQDNLKLFGGALNDYANKNEQELPQLKKDNPRHTASAFMPLLKMKTKLPERLSVSCPGCSPRVLDADIPSFVDLERLTEEEFVSKMRPLLEMDTGYAYPLGYEQNGRHCAPRMQNDLFNSSVMPIVADRPSIPGPDGSPRGNSPNHKGKGQNVLFLGGNVRFCPTPYNPFNDKDHLYLNNDGKVAAGLDQWDTVLGCQGDRP